MNEEQLYAMRHSLAHITAQAVQHLWPEAKFGVGPVIDNGFYYDIDLGDNKVSEDDFKRIEKEMRGIINRDFPFERSEKPVDEAIMWAKEANQPYKVELLNDLKREGTTLASELDATMMGMELPVGTSGTPHNTVRGVVDVSLYTDGDFTDLCRGPHAESTGKVGAFKLMRVAGAYWRGNEKNPQMQRLYGVAFATQDELEHYLTMLEEAKKRDHRKLGQELDLFTTSLLVGAGLPLFTPRGTILREELAKFSTQLRENFGFQKVWTPHITKIDLYKTSGHWDKFGDELFLVKSQETNDEFALKPMNCPHHTQIYAAKARSYRDLPVRYCETTTDYRDEKTGELGGLSRVRSLTQDDSHAFCRQDQIEQEINQLLSAANTLYEALNMKLRVRLSYRDDGDGYLGDAELWQTAQLQLKSAVITNKLEYFEVEGEAAFYGPKIDFMATDALGREHQVATVQLDFVQPGRFGLEYTDEGGGKQTPVMIHCALMGSIERFLSVYIEHTGGRFPVWLAPEQLRIIQVKDSDDVLQFVQRLKNTMFENGIRYVVDDTNESVGKKIRAAATMKIPYTLVIGEKEVAQEKLTPRIRNDLVVEGYEEHSYDVEQFFTSLAREVKARASKSLL